jgi:cell division protein FtsL
MAPTRRPRVVNGPLVKPREPGRFGDLARMTLLGLLLALPAFLYAGLQGKLHEYRRDVVGLEQRNRDLDEERRRLDIEFASASDPQRIGELAREVTGLVDAERDQVIYLPRTPVAPARDLMFLAEATGNADGRQRP